MNKETINNLAEELAAHANLRHSGAEHPLYPTFTPEDFAAILNRYIPDVPDEDETPIVLELTPPDSTRTIPLTADETPLRKIAAELLRLYDWRFELAEEEAELRNTPVETGDIREVASLPPQSFDASALEMRRAALDKKLRQYGREKKAAWDALREELDTQPVEQEKK